MRTNDDFSVVRGRSSETNDMAVIIRENIEHGKSTTVVNQHETFYGWDFDSHLRKSLIDCECDIQVIKHDKFEGFPSQYIVSPKK